MFHCHNLIHEDHSMMAVMNITLLEALGYDTNTTGYADPTDSRFAPKAYSDEAFTPDAESAAVLSLANLNPYGDPLAAIAAQNSYYATAGFAGETTVTIAPSAPTQTTGRPDAPTRNPGGPSGGRPTTLQTLRPATTARAPTGRPHGPP
jgi:expansin (peptidoglycan-binding protein)